MCLVTCRRVTTYRRVWLGLRVLLACCWLLNLRPDRRMMALDLLLTVPTISIYGWPQSLDLIRLLSSVLTSTPGVPKMWYRQSLTHFADGRTFLSCRLGQTKGVAKRAGLSSISRGSLEFVVTVRGLMRPTVPGNLRVVIMFCIVDSLPLILAADDVHLCAVSVAATPRLEYHRV